MTSGQNSIHLQLARRLAIVGGLVALVLGGAALLFELEQMDEAVVDVTVREAHRFIEASAMRPDEAAGHAAIRARLAEFLAERTPGPDGRFVEIEIYDAGQNKIAEASLAGSAWSGRAAALPHVLPQTGYWYRKHLIERTLFVQVVVPMPAARTGYFEGVFEISQARTADIARAGAVAVLAVVLAVFATTGALYPAILSMNRDLARYTEGLEDALRRARDAGEATKAKSRFLATMSHELRTPLNGVVGALELLRTTALPADAARLAATAHGASNQLLAVIGDILDFSKIEAGGIELECAAFDPRALLGQVAEAYGALAKAHGLELSVEIGDGVPAALVGDATRLRQILSNLVANAIKFTHSGGVRICAVLERPVADGRAELAVEVADSGIGMTDVQLTQLFEPFTQADSSTQRRYGGTGLGLAISRRLAERMGGTLDARSKRGSGSVFRLRIGFDTADAGGLAPASSAPGPVPAGYAGMRVLVAEDNATNRQIIVGQLARFGLVADVVEDGAAAVAAAAANAYDLILLDFHMPGMDGPEACRRIRADEAKAGRRTPVIAVTASALAEEAEACRAAGMDEVVCKPVTLARLAEAIGRRLAPGGVTPALDLRFLAEALGPLDEPWVAAAMRDFVANLTPQMAALDLATVAHDDAGAARAAHAARGAARSAGAGTLAAQLEAYERGAAAGDWPAADAARTAAHGALAAVASEIDRIWGKAK